MVKWVTSKASAYCVYAQDTVLCAITLLVLLAYGAKDIASYCSVLNVILYILPMFNIGCHCVAVMLTR